jgi:maltose-binding protein MalE
MEYAGRQKLMVMLGSQSGDIYSFPKDEFESMAKTGAFLPLDDYTDLLKHFTKEQLEEYTYTTEYDQTPRIYGVPVSDVESIGNTFFKTENSVMGVMAYSKNSEKAVEVLEWIEKHKTEEQYQQRKQELLKTKEEQEVQKQQEKQDD